jgi:hypothetical protein
MAFKRKREITNLVTMWKWPELPGMKYPTCAAGGIWVDDKISCSNKIVLN